MAEHRHLARPTPAPPADKRPRCAWADCEHRGSINSPLGPLCGKHGQQALLTEEERHLIGNDSPEPAR